MRFQMRDGEVLKAIFDNDGILARRQIKEMFWPRSSWRAMERRLSKLFHAGYIKWPSLTQHKEHPIPEPICWLDWKGALYIAGVYGLVVEAPKSDGENQLRRFQKRLRSLGIRWVREPRWSLLKHDLSIVDFKIAVEKSIAELVHITLERWTSESLFRFDMDVVEYEVVDRSGEKKRMSKGICPDAYFEIVDQERHMRGEPHRARFLLELDMASHDNQSFGREKSLPGVAYIKSPAYKTRFGQNNGHWLVVTIGRERRLRNLIRNTRLYVGDDAELFFFTSIESLLCCNALISPIWHQVGSNQPVSLIRH